jgi:transposase-like protein
MLGRGYNKAEVANAFGVTDQTIGQWSKIVGMAAPVRNAIESGQVSATAAAKLADLAKEEQVKELERLVAEGGGKVTVSKAAGAARRRKNGNSNDAPSRRVIRKVVEATKSEDCELPEDFVRGLRWVLGDLDPAAVKGLSALIAK